MFGELTRRLAVQCDASGAEVLGEVGAGARAGDQEDVRGQAEQPRQGDLRGGGVVAGGDGDDARVVEDAVACGTWPAERAVQDERDLVLAAFAQDSESWSARLAGSGRRRLGDRRCPVQVVSMLLASPVDEAFVAGLIIAAS